MTIVAPDPLLDGGLLPVDRAREAWWVRPGATTAVAVRDGDRVTITALADGRTAEVTTAAGRSVRMLGADTAAGASVDVAVDRDGVLSVAAPDDGEVIALPGVLLLEIWRAEPQPRPGAVEHELPPPLAEPRLDFRVDAASARSYEVRAGEYIQVIDVAGRQCSDFLAFRADALQRGVERGLDATTTRTLSGNAFPQPGLNNKFFDQDMRPLVEIVRDTVGRHDAFALACTARYYEDLGYPGHRNCSENFNGQLAAYAIAPRPGWPALNFFYNTAFDAANVLTLDEPWSRAGDHVLLRASTDLVCASSACPDDVDPSNGWEVTDVHVRVYAPDNRFSMAVTRRMAPGVEPVTTRETAFHPRIAALTDSMCDTNGYWVADHFDGRGAVEEYWACRERVAVMDLSQLRKWEVLGPDAITLMQRVVTRDVRKLAVGQVVYTAMCQDTGTMLDDATVFRMTEDNFRLIGGSPGDGPWLEELAQESGLRVHVKPATDALHNLAVQGPLSRDVLRAIVWTPPGQPTLDDLRWFRFLVGRIGNREGTPIVVSRTGYTGELGYEVFCHPDDGLHVWDAVMDAGAPHGISPLGMEALDMLRVESGLILAGREFDQDTDPFEAGIGFTVALDTEEDFVGKAALVERRAHPQRQLVGLLIDGDEVPCHGDGVFVGRRKVGVVTSGVHSPTFQRAIALCRMSVTDAEPGTAVDVSCNDGLYRRLAATVTTIPFYDPKKERPRS